MFLFIEQLFLLFISLFLLTVKGGLTFISGDDSDDYNHCETAASCNGLIVTIFNSAISLSRVKNTQKDVLALGITGGQALAAFQSWQSGSGFSADVLSTDNEIMNVDFSKYKVIYMPSSELQVSGGISCAQLTLVSSRSDSIKYFVNTLKGSLMTLTQDGCTSGYTFLVVPLTTASVYIDTVIIESALSSVVTSLNSNSLNHCCYHTGYPGPAGYGGLEVLAYDPVTGYPIILGGWNVILTAEICNDGIDNDADGFIDSADPDCPESICNDGKDNNNNGFADCDDPDCQLSWPLCQHPTILPQLNCQGSLTFHNNTAKCHQVGRGTTIFDFFTFPLPNITHSSVTNFIVTGSDYIEDTMYNCGPDNEISFGSASFLHTSNSFSGSISSSGQGLGYGPNHYSHKTGIDSAYFMIQKYTISIHKLTNYLDSIQHKSVFLFQKGAFGNGTAYIYPALNTWSEHNLTCQTLKHDLSGQIYDTHCSNLGPSQIYHIYGWSYVNITHIVHCLLHNYLTISYSTHHTTIPLSFIWMEDSYTIKKQVWYSSESLFSPILAFFYTPN